MSRFYTHVAQHRGRIYVRGYDNGKRYQTIEDYEPYVFLPTEKETPYLTLYGHHVTKKRFNSIYDAREFCKKYSETEGFNIYGLTNNWQYLYLYDTFPGEIQHDPTIVSVVSLDIETKFKGGFPDIKLAQKEITAITLRKSGQAISLGYRQFKPKPGDVYVQCKNEVELLSEFLRLWNELDPDVITGWNVEFFDLPYIVNRINRVLGEGQANRLSPWNFLEEREITIRGRNNQVFMPAGLTVLDYLQLYRKFSFKNQESYKLDHIAEEELGTKKIDYSDYGDLDDLYLADHQLYMEYNVHDTVLVDMLEDKLKFIEQVFALAYDAKVNYVDTMATVRPWDIIIHNYLLDRGIVVEPMEVKRMDRHLIGGHVKTPIPAMYKWVVSFDLYSMYPHLIMQYNISPETLRGKWHDPDLDIDAILKGKLSEADIPFREKNLCIAANLCMFTRDFQGFLPEIMQKMYDDRAKYKNLMLEAKKKFEETKSKEDEKLIARYHNLQLAKKIQLNSAFGALGNQYFRWFSLDLAEAITASGQLTIRWIEEDMNKLFNTFLHTKGVDYVIASDTDSIYLNFEGVVKQLGLEDKDPHEITKYIDSFCKEVLDFAMTKSYERLADYMNAYEQKMFMKRETIADRGIWTAKKRYILNAYNIEGVAYKEPKLKIMGIESVRSSTPKVVREAIKDTLKVIMTGSESATIDYIDEFRERFKEFSFEQVGRPSTANGLSQYSDKASIYKKGTPIHVKGALIYNFLLKKLGLEEKYPAITEGDKIKFVVLKTPNPIHERVISCLDELPREFKLDKYVDHEEQFEKAYLQPMSTIINAIGWATERKASLEDFFA